MKAIPFGRYILLEKLAMGGTAEIFRAKLLGVEGFEKEVVIKRILPPWSANPQFISMLIDEAKILVRLQDQRIVQVYELGRENDLYYISMEYVKGWDLRHIIRSAKEQSKPFALSECFYVIGEILKGLEYIHKQSDKRGQNLEIVHRDISPQNILISTEGKIKIADFGIAHARSRSYETSTGVIKGKFSYMSPEQARGEKLNLKTDLFATGILLYEMITLQKIFQGKSDLEVLNQVRNFHPDTLIQQLMVPPSLQKILRRALAPEISLRYSSAREFLNDLQESALSLSEEKGEEIFSKRLETLKPPEQEEMESALPFPWDADTHAIVSREWVSDTSMDITRSIEHAFEAQTDRNPSLTPLPKYKRKTGHAFRWIFPVLILGLVLFLYFYTEVLQKPESLLSKALPESQPPPQMTENKISSQTPPLPPPKTPTPPSPGGRVNEVLPKGILSVRASPWGKISVSGVASNVEKPLLRSLPYGNYRVSVRYQNSQGEWTQVSQSVKIAKASTLCSASFQKDGRGVISCR